MMMMTVRALRALVVLLSGVLVSVAGAAEGPGPPAAAEGGVRGEIDTAPLDRWRLYHLPEGSEIFPASWVAAMNDKTSGRPFLDDLERFGLLPDDHGPEVRGAGKTWRLPVGLTLAKPPNSSLEMVGVNCAACHVGELVIGNTVVRVDGAPNLFNLDRFYEQLFESAKATLSEPARFRTFLERLKRAEGNRDEFRTFFDRLGEGLARDDPLCRAVVERARAILEDPDEAGPGRLNLLAAAHSGRVEAAVRSVVERDQRFVERVKGQFPGVKSLAALRDDLARKRPEPDSLAEALARVGDDRLLFLEARLGFLKRLKGLHDAPPGEKALVPGPGRIDAIINARDLVFPADAINPNSAVSYPPLWGLRRIRWFHYDGDTTSLMDRNMAQSMGLGAVVIQATGESTILPRNLHELEILNGRLEPPKWTERVGPVGADESLLQQGAALYQRRCAGCHEFRGDENRPLMAGESRPFGFPVYDLGTDPQRAMNFARPMKDGREFARVLSATLATIKAKLYETHHITQPEREAMEPRGGVRWVTTRGYIARPLRGVWATAPYLHNGSVPTLDDLLKPAADRPKTFLVGYRVYDADTLGYVSDPQRIPEDARKGLFEFDTSLAGNKNSGHEPGPVLTGNERKALIAYLKTL